MKQSNYMLLLKALSYFDNEKWKLCFWCILYFFFQNPEELLDNNATFFTNFNIVIATDLQEK